MQDEVFVYKCPNFGGKVEYIDNKWHCSYCNNAYDALFSSKEISLPSIEQTRYTLYSYYCDSCNNRFISKESTGAKCDICHKNVETGKKFVASSIITLDVTLEEAIKKYNEHITKYKDRINKDFYNPNLVLKYFNCDLYNGFIELSYNGIVEKYIFVNLLIPNICYDDYLFMYELGNIGYTNGIELFDENKNIEEEIIKNGKYIYDIEDKNPESKIIDYCLKDFGKKYNISKDQINVRNNLKIHDGVLIPIYFGRVESNGKVYYQYVFGNSDKTKKISGLSTFNNTYDITLFELPEDNDSFEKYKKNNEMYKKLRIPIIVFVTASIYLFERFIFESNSTMGILFFITLISTIIISIIYSISKNNCIYYLKTVKIDEDHYYNQIITNSNYVKVIKVKK